MAEFGTGRPGLAFPGDAEPGALGGGGVQITPNTGSLAITGQPVALTRITTHTGSLSLTGQTPAVRQHVRLTPNTGSLTLTGKSVSVATESKIVSKEYIGDGASTRSFVSVGFVPMAVIVFGKDGAGSLVGAIKTANMASGISQPLNSNVAAGAASRQNRILTLDANGFTVGPDLNVNGRNYAYIMFPIGRKSVVNSGTFAGHGGDQTRNSTLRTNNGDPTLITGDTQIIGADGRDCAIAWHHPVGGNAYDPSQALVLGGRRIIRNSDGAVICEMTQFNSTQSANGNVYIAGVFGGNTWHLEEDYIDLEGNDADLVFVLNSDTCGNAVPYTVTKSAWMGATNQGWTGTGTGELLAHLGVAGDTRLHILPSAGFSTPGVEYTWFSVKGGVTALGLGVGIFNYVGDQSIDPQVLSGLPFTPEWIWGTNGGADFRWAKRSTAIIGSGKTRLWGDGSGDTNNYTNTFTADGINIAGGPGQFWNANGGLYTFILFVADSPAERITITPQTGNLNLVPKNPIRAQKRLITPNTGTLRFTGQDPKVKEKHIPNPPGKPPKTINLRIDDEGHLTLTGRQPVLKRGIRPLSGSLTLTPAKPFVRPPDFVAFTNTGALSLTGQQPKQRITITPGTGALALNGQAGILNQSVPKRLTINTAPELTLTGNQPVLKTSIIPITGELQLQTFNTEPIVETNVVRITPLTGDLSISGVSPATNPDVSLGMVPNTGSLVLTGQLVIVRSAVAITPNTGALTLTGQPIIVTAPVSITPNTGALVLDGQSVIVHGAGTITPQTGSLVLTGQPVIVQAQGDVTITPGCGALNLIGRPCIVVAPSPTPPIPPSPGVVGGGVGLPHPRKLPFWPKPIVTARGRMVAPAACFRGRIRVEESELSIFLE